MLIHGKLRRLTFPLPPARAEEWMDFSGINYSRRCIGKVCNRIFQRIKAYKQRLTSGNFRSSTARSSRGWSIIRVCWTRWRKPGTRLASKLCYPSWNGGSSRTRKLSDNGQLWGDPLKVAGTRRIRRWPPRCCSSPGAANSPSNWWLTTAHRYFLTFHHVSYFIIPPNNSKTSHFVFTRSS